MAFSSQNDTTAVLNHIVSQTRQNIEFLMAQKHISESAGREILFKLPTPSSVAALTDKAQTMSLLPAPAPNRNLGRRVPSPTQRKVEARAIWDWESEDPDDLMFKAGDVIEIVAETNTDWWTGRHNGKQGLFPSNYVEKMKNIAPPPPAFPEVPRSASPYQSKYSSPAPSGPPSYAPPSGPPPSGYYGYQPPPVAPQPAAYNPYMAPTAPLNSIEPAPQQEPPKKSRFGGLGNTMAQSAAGGVGFGAGSAVGSGIINSLF